MKARTASRLAWSTWATCVAAVLVGTVVGLRHVRANDPGGPAPTITTVMFLIGFSTVGALVASKRRENPIGWLLLVAAVSFAAGGLAVTVDQNSQNAAAQWLSSWVWGVGAFLSLSLPFLLFPDGKVPSPRWRPIEWAAVIGIGTFVVASALAPGLIADTDIPNPIGLGGAGKTIFPALRGAGAAIAIAAGICSIGSLFFRYHRAARAEREQLRWLMFAGGIVIFAIFAQGPVSSAASSPELALNIQNAITAAALTLIPIAIGVAILKYRLYDIDLVLNKTVVYGALAAFITVVYVTIVVGIGSLAGRGGDPNVALSIFATAIVAAAFQPVRERVQRFANRLVYGQRATPYEVLAELSQRMAGVYANEDLLPRMARILAEGTGSARADVWLRTDDLLRVDASWPADAEPLPPVDVADLPDDLAPVRHQGELLGALAIQKKPGEAITPTEQRLIDDLASQAGLVLKNVGLTEQLIARLDELKASRQRLVSAQDEERRKIERNIHDGAQQQLVALAVRQRLAASLIGKDDDAARRAFEELQARTNEALEDLRDLARGIYPPLLADKGLPAALEAQARKALLPVTIEPDGIGRYPQQIESAVYFSVLEALQNVAKYAEATCATVRLSQVGDGLTFEVADDGRGFDPSATGYGTGLQGIADRLAALDGELNVTSTPGGGTVVAGRLPAESTS